MATNKRAYAYILRRKGGGMQLLAFKEEGKGLYKPYHLPGGGVDPGEVPEEAVRREIFEESGLVDLPPGQLLGQWIEQQEHEIFQRYFFLFKDVQGLPDSWVHRVTGKGVDAGINYHYCWFGAEEALRIHLIYHAYLSCLHLPDLFAKGRLLGAQPRQLHLLPYAEHWAAAFTDESTRVRKAAGNSVLNLEHVGGTAVPGMVAQPVVDMAMSCHSEFFASDLPKIRLEALGYEEVGEVEIPARKYFVRRNDVGEICFALAVFPDRSAMLQRFIDLRQELLADDRLVETYNRIKLKAWQRSDGDVQTYRRAKEAFYRQFFQRREPQEFSPTRSMNPLP